MAHKKKNLMKKLMKKLRKDGEASPQGRSTMSSDPFHPAVDPNDGTASIPEVTPAVLEEAAHKAAQLADGVAHHTIALAATAVGGSARGEHESAQVAQEEHDAASAGDNGAAISGARTGTTGATAGARDAAERAARAADAGLSGASDALGQYNAKVVEIVRTNMAATGALFVALLQTKSLPEAVALNADHMRRQVDTLTSQGRELATLAQKMALAALQPFKDVIPRDR